MDPLFWSAMLMVLAMTLVVVEIFSPPPYGIIGFLAVAAAAASIYMAFHSSGPAIGFSFVAVAVFGLPTVLALAIRYWPHTPMGRAVMLEVPRSDEVLPADDPSRWLPQLIGKVGQARTKMRPGGAVSIEGHTYEAVSEGISIDEGEAVRVVQVRHNRLVVRKSEEPPPSTPRQSDDILSQPIDSLGLDSFQDPLA